MFVAAAEETQENLIQGRGDAYCGMLNASYNLALRNIGAYIPEYPVGDADDCADMIHEFLPIARAIYGLNNLKIISFGPRPLNFLACNAPIKQLYNVGVEIEENSELDLFEAFNKHAGDERIPDVVKDMEKELGEGNKKPEILEKLAQYELTLLDWVDEHKGYRKYVAIAGKCWPAFQTQFGFVPCYVNSRLTGRGIPVSCEVDIYGVLSEPASVRMLSHFSISTTQCRRICTRSQSRADLTTSIQTHLWASTVETPVQARFATHR
jgi:L-fucose isomerase-like protein